MWKRLLIFAVALVVDVALLRWGWQTQQFNYLTDIGKRLFEEPILPCTIPIRYRIDQIDPEFKLSSEDFIKDASAAAQIWNTAKGNPVFIYDPQGELSVNLVYDGRQKLSAQINQMQSSLQTAAKSLTPQEQQFRKEVAAYEQKASALNAEIVSWNEKGGAPQETADQLNNRVTELKAEADRLNTESERLNKISSNYNAQVGTLNKTVDTFNSQLNEKPEEGIFIGDENKIEIYFNNGKQELVHTLAHEMGHALGMNHVDDKKAILYESTNLSVKPSEKDLLELEKACAPPAQKN